MKKNNSLKRALQYIYIPIIMSVLGGLGIFLAARPAIKLAYNMLGIIISDSTPNFKTELGSIYDPLAEPLSRGEISYEDVEFPAYETHYAQIQCKRLDMDVPLYWGDSDRVFREGAGQYIGSFIPGYGGVILAGAHDSMYFEPLQDVKEGDRITVRTNYGIFTYRVTSTKIASDSDSEVFNDLSDSEQLVLYTCYPFGALIGVKNQRFYVFADKVSGPEIIRE